MKQTLISNATIVNEGESFNGHVLIEGAFIKDVFKGNTPEGLSENIEVINAQGLTLMPGVIDDQVHFREPGLMHKEEIYTGAKAGVAGGTTTFMEMPNTNPQTTAQDELRKKFDRAADVSLANYSFFFGATNDNLDQVLATDPKNVCGIKIFMGSSTGNMLVDNTESLEKIFSSTKLLIATHCEDEETIRANSSLYRDRYGDNMPMSAHPLIRSAEACYLSSSKAAALAAKQDARLHILHISTAKETSLFRNDIPLKDKRLTAEACIHHLWFSDADYDTKGTYIKWNPAVKTADDREGVWKALLDDRIDIVATDHAPHTIDEKSQNYWSAPSGGPLIQHSMQAMMDFVKQGRISIERAVEKLSHAPAICFQIHNRGFIRKGYFADLVLVDLNAKQTVEKSNLLYKCGWSPFEGHTFSSVVDSTFVNGRRVYHQGKFDESLRGQAITFDR